MKLIRYQSHNNGIAVFFNHQNKKFYKYALNSYGKKLLINENLGSYYFNKISNNKIKFCYNEKRGLFTTDKIEGIIRNYNISFDKNFEYFQLITRFYLKNWTKNHTHGDLTLDNIVFLKNNKNLIIFDWEHYINTKNINYGFDLLYCLLSGIILPGRSNFNKKSKNNFKTLYRYLYNSKIDKNFLINPVKKINLIIARNYYEIFNNSFSKFITFSENSDFLNEIELFIKKECIDV